ncbi:MAG: SPX domain protein involved in polyphosphate accumulation [Saprospiraceae bacterium]|jgi:SPX domain protein involved in polyphosphate accumulation
MRYERKYRIENQHYLQVLQEIMSINGAFYSAYPDRWVNSIYLDNMNYGALRENLSGVSNRSKYRLRWYGENFQNIHNPILEEKVKTNLLGYKNLQKLDSTTLSGQNLRQSLDIALLQNLGLEPVVMVRYIRTYLESFDRRVRITIDRDLQYRGMNNYVIDPFSDSDEALILEIKYDQDIEEDIQDILQSVKYRLTKNSKFVSAMMGYWG